MDLSKYQELTGLTVASAQSPYMTAQLKRVRHILEGLLGFPLTPDKTAKNLYTELGKVQNTAGDFWPIFDLDTLTENLLPPDEVVYAYRLFDFNWSDVYIHIDPFTTINAVKLVYNNVTLKTFDPNEIRVEVGRDGVSKYIEVVDRFGFQRMDYAWDNIQLAIDANWMMEETAPYDLLYVWSEMVGYYSDQKNNVQTEQIGLRGGHSYTKYAKEIPETLPHNLSVINRYAGPLGSATANPTVGVKSARSSAWWL